MVNIENRLKIENPVEWQKLIDSLHTELRKGMYEMYIEMVKTMGLHIDDFYNFDISFIKRILTELSIAEKTIDLFLRDSNIPLDIKQKIIGQIGGMYFTKSPNGLHWNP